MSGRLDLNDEQMRALYALIRSTLMPLGVRQDPASRPLREIAVKLQKQANRAFCGGCGKPEVYALGKCEACYRARRRKAG